MSNQPLVSSNALLEIICLEIDQAQGLLPFRRFMELALYHPKHGYYASGRARIGKEGDFFTSVSVGPIYGRLLASICREVWERIGSPSEFVIIEQGANDGMLAADILEAIMAPSDAFSSALRYLIVEPFSINHAKQQARLSFFANVSWLDSLEKLSHFTGIHLSSELLDAFPVHSLCWDGTAWLEKCVGRKGDELIWCTKPIADSELIQAAEQLPKDLSPGFCVEMNLEVRYWLTCLYEKMEQGIILTIDYGQVREDRYAPHRADGTLLAYEKHKRFNDPLSVPGQRDITAQVDFTALAHEAKAMGFEILGYSDQHHFLVGAAEPWLRSLGDSAPQHQSDLRALQTLLNPSTMGMQFKAIALGKEFPRSPSLDCFKYQRPGVEVL